MKKVIIYIFLISFVSCGKDSSIDSHQNNEAVKSERVTSFEGQSWTDGEECSESVTEHLDKLNEVIVNTWRKGKNATKEEIHDCIDILESILSDFPDLNCVKTTSENERVFYKEELAIKTRDGFIDRLNN